MAWLSDHKGGLELTITAVGAIAEFGVALFIFFDWRHAHRAEISRITEGIFTEWWGDTMREYRRYFYRDFLKQDRARLIVENKGLKDLLPSTEHSDEDERNKLMQFCYFFDRVGFLGASGLLNVDYVLAPMQHVIRRVWFAVGPLVKRSRQADSTYGADPNFLHGFEWL